MDSVTQFVLGASVAAAVLGRRTGAWRAVLWGGVVATLPDLDVLFDHGDAVSNMTCHRAESHSILWLTLLSPWLAWGIATVHRERHLFLRWWWAVWLALITHVLLDAMTIYGTQIGLPFTTHPFAVGSLFVIDPLYTVPLAFGALMFALRRDGRGVRWNWSGLLLSTMYAAWSVVAQQWATEAALAALRARGIEGTRLCVMAAPLQTMLWRIVAVDDHHAYEGFWSVWDGERPVALATIDRGASLRPLLADNWAFLRLTWFTGDCTKIERDGDGVRVTDLRLGQEPFYMFSFVLATLDAEGRAQPVLAPSRTGARIDIGRGVAWVWSRMWGAEVPTPR